MRRVLMFAMALAIARATFADDLTRRLEPLAGSGNRIVATVFDNYRSGRPRRVVAAFGDSEEAALLLILLPDSARGKPRIVDREALDGRPGDILLERVIDAKDIIVSLPLRHGVRSIVDRVIANHLARIAEDFSEAVDLDGDGVPEIIASSYAGQSQCGTGLFVSLGRWNGKRYVNDRRRYLTVLSNGKGKDGDELLLSASKRYVVRIFGSGCVTFDEHDVVPGKPFRTEEDCHSIALHHGGARTRAFLEEVD